MNNGLVTRHTESRPLSSDNRYDDDDKYYAVSTNSSIRLLHSSISVHHLKWRREELSCFADIPGEELPTPGLRATHLFAL